MPASSRTHVGKESARALALVADVHGATDEAFQQAEDARTRSNRLPDPYVWLDGYILDPSVNSADGTAIQRPEAG